MERCEHPESGRKKKLIASVLMCYEPWSKIFVCKCFEKKERGCVKPKRGAVIKIQCICNGNKGCDLCKGKGEIVYNRCPAAISADPETRSFMPFFYRYKEYGEYPDARGRLFQPVKLTLALDLMMVFAVRKETQNLERAYGRK